MGHGKSPYLKYADPVPFPVLNRHSHYDHLFEEMHNIPGYPASIFWLMNQFGYDYMNEPHQTSCTAWNYHGSGTSNPVALSAVWLRNMHQAWKTGYYPLIHCGTSFGSYKETREQLIFNRELREAVKPILKKLGRLTEDGRIVIPQEVVHYSEWVHANRFKIKELYEKEGKAKGIDVSSVRVAIHGACHVWKMMADDYPYDPEVYGGQRPAVLDSGTYSRKGSLPDPSPYSGS